MAERYQIRQGHRWSSEKADVGVLIDTVDGITWHITGPNRYVQFSFPVVMITYVPCVLPMYHVSCVFSMYLCISFLFLLLSKPGYAVFHWQIFKNLSKSVNSIGGFFNGPIELTDFCRFVAKICQ